MIASESRPHRRAAAAHLAVAAVFLIVFGALVFTRLGQYALWDDEANTALFAEAVWRTGDTTAVLGHNVIAYRNGSELQGYSNRYFAPLQYYLCAPFAGIGERDAFAVRLPFALTGVAAAALASWWLWRRRGSLLTHSLLALGFLGNVSLVLFSRQCRYYGPVILFSMLATYCYVERDGSRRHTAGLALSLGLLAATHYLAFAALGAVLAVDYFAFGRRDCAYSKREIAAIAGFVGVAAVALVSVWNPLLSRPTSYGITAADRLILFYRNMRDLNASELGVGVLILSAPILYFTGRRDPALLRLPVAVVVYCLAIALCSPQQTELTFFADVRYLVALIPACIFVAVRAIEALPGLPAAVRVGLAVLAFGTNFGNVALASIMPGAKAGPPRSTLLAYVAELRSPLPSPYAEAAKWIKSYVEPGQSVFAYPEHTMYPLMFHAGHAVYAWQFKADMRSQYPELPDIHFKNHAFPDYVFTFGPAGGAIRPLLGEFAKRGVVYLPVAGLSVNGHDFTRPELFWRSFKAPPIASVFEDGVTIFRRTDSAP